jgi:transcriptional regulator with XRE-family HTH domain
VILQFLPKLPFVNIDWTVLKDARALKGWTQQDLADAVGVSVRTIVNWETTGVPSRSTRKIERALGDELRYSHFISNFPDDLDIPNFDEWKQDMRDRQAWLLAQEEGRESSDLIDMPANWEAQEAYDAEVWDMNLRETNDRRSALSSFTTEQLLNEINIRVKQLEKHIETDAPGNVIDADDRFGSRFTAPREIPELGYVAGNDESEDELDKD